MKIKEFFDKNTSTLTYVVYNEKTRDAVIIDPVLDFDPADGRIWDESFQKHVTFIEEQGLQLHQVLETHVHADHLTSSALFKKRFPKVQVFINERIREVQSTFQKIFQLSNFACDGSQFDHLLKDGEQWSVGALQIKSIFTPGHTPACTTFAISDMGAADAVLFTGDAIFMPDSGTGRCDFPQGSARALYQSISEKIYSWPDSTPMYVGHDYQPGGRALMFCTTVGEQKKNNIHIKADTKHEAYVEFRETRDKTLAAPRLLLPSLQINMRAGQWLAPGESGPAFLKLPLKIQIQG